MFNFMLWNLEVGHIIYLHLRSLILFHLKRLGASRKLRSVATKATGKAQSCYFWTINLQAVCHVILFLAVFTYTLFSWLCAVIAATLVIATYRYLQRFQLCSTTQLRDVSWVARLTKLQVWSLGGCLLEIGWGCVPCVNSALWVCSRLFFSTCLFFTRVPFLPFLLSWLHAAAQCHCLQLYCI